jgi:hypothetical protein
MRDEPHVHEEPDMHDEPHVEHTPRFYRDETPTFEEPVTYEPELEWDADQEYEADEAPDHEAEYDEPDTAEMEPVSVAQEPVQHQLDGVTESADWGWDDPEDFSAPV